jgi:acyl-CoA dehydrogenase
MDFDSTPEHSMIRGTASEIADQFGPEYWREKEREEEFGQDYWDELAKAGFHGLLVPDEYGGADMGMQEMGLAMETLCAEGCGMAGTWYLVLTAGMAAVGLRDHGTADQKERYLPDLAAGDREFCIGITEPEAGTNTLNVATTAERDGDEYVLNGNKAWITFSDRADNMVIVTRTTPQSEVDRAIDGISLFVVDMDDPGIEISPIAKHAMNYSKSCEVFLTDVRVHEDDLLGEEDAGMPVLFDMLNPERIGFAAAGTGIGMLAANEAIRYANDREVFDAPIGTHQGVSFPITSAYAGMESARLMRQKASWLFDQGEDCAYETNVAKATAVEAGIEAVKQSMQAFGGWGYAEEYDVERWFREINLTRLAPVSQQMAYNHISQELGFPKSY